jgi:hypothetical protein
LRLESLTERVAKSREVSRILTKFLHTRSKYRGVNQVLASVPPRMPLPKFGSRPRRPAAIGSICGDERAAELLLNKGHSLPPCGSALLRIGKSRGFRLLFARTQDITKPWLASRRKAKRCCPNLRKEVAMSVQPF